MSEETKALTRGDTITEPNEECILGISDVCGFDIDEDKKPVALEMEGAEIDSIADLREHFVLDDAIELVRNRKLYLWLKQLYYEREADAVRKLRMSAGNSFSDKNKRELCGILGIDYEKVMPDTERMASERHTEEAERFGVNERSIQRDIDEIRAFLDERAVSGKDSRCVVYDRSKKGFVIEGDEGSMLDNNEILAVSKILLASRAFTKPEISVILDKIISGCVPQKNMKLVSDLVSNEKYHYVQPRHNSKVMRKMWELGEHIRNREYIEISYYRQGENCKNTVDHIVEPTAVIFSEYYFYLITYTVKQNDDGKYERTHDYPTVFRLDRITKCRSVGVNFSVSYANRFEEGVFRKRVQFMYAGELIHLKLKYTGKSVNAVLDRLPTAEIISESDGEWLIKADVYGKGILMWLLSQGDLVEVLEPPELRKQMVELVRRMQEIYIK